MYACMYVCTMCTNEIIIIVPVVLRSLQDFLQPFLCGGPTQPGHPSVVGKVSTGDRMVTTTTREETASSA